MKIMHREGSMPNHPVIDGMSVSIETALSSVICPKCGNKLMWKTRNASYEVYEVPSYVAFCCGTNYFMEVDDVRIFVGDESYNGHEETS